MARELTDIDELIRNRARREAKKEAQEAVERLPYFGEITWPTQDTGGQSRTITMQNFAVREKLQKAIEASIYLDKVAHYTSRILSLMDEVDELKDGLANLETQR